MFKLNKKVAFGIFLILSIFFYDDVKTAFLISYGKVTLPHYDSSTQITANEFDSISSQIDIDYDPYGSTFVTDIVENAIYESGSGLSQPYDTYIFLNKYLNSTSSNSEQQILPGDRRFVFDGGLACFSCGCECYADRTVIIAGGRYFLLASGEDYAHSPERQGLYYYFNDKWTKITPKIDLGGKGFGSMEREIANNKIKFFEQGCSVAYYFEGNPHKINVCNLE